MSAPTSRPFLVERPDRIEQALGKTQPRNFEGGSVELDAIPASLLRELVRECIEGHVDPDQLRTLQVAEQSERQLLHVWAHLGGR